MTENPTPRKRRYGRWILVAMLVLIACAAGVVLFWEKLPYQGFASRQVASALEGMGLTVNHLRVEALSQREASITALDIGENTPLKAKKIVAQYDWQDVQHGKLRTLSVDGLDVTVMETPQGWYVGGLEPLLQGEGAAPAAPSPIFDDAMLRSILPSDVTVQNARIHVTGNGLKLNANLDGTLKTQEKISTAWQVKEFAGALGDIAIAARTASSDATFNAEKKSWNLSLNIPEITVSGTEEPVPPLSATLTGNVNASRITVKGDAADKEKKYQVRFSANLPSDNPQKGTLNIERFRMAWGGGTISVADMSVPLSLKKPIRVPLSLERVELSQLLDALGDERIKGSGIVSGTLPVLYHPDGTISLEPGGVEALETGELHVAPELIPGGTNENLDTVRVALANFRYDLLKISVLSGKDGRPTIRLEVEGRNVEAFGGRPLKLNVNLTGDVLPLIQQSILPVNDVKQLLKLQEQAP